MPQSPKFPFKYVFSMILKSVHVCHAIIFHKQFKYMMKVAVLFVGNTKSCSFLDYVAKYDLYQSRDYHFISLDEENHVKRVQDLVNTKEYDLFINLCQGSIGYHLAQVLQKVNAAYTGAGPKFYEVSKTGIQIAATTSGVNIPDYGTIESMEELTNQRQQELGLPLILKNDLLKLGCSKQNIVRNCDELQSQVSRFLEKFGRVTIEQYIDGPEIHALVIENLNDQNNPEVLVPVRCEKLDIGTADEKNMRSKFKNGSPVVYSAISHVKLTENLKDASKKIFSACNFDGYARCDFRVHEKTGQIYFMGLKPNPGVFRSEDHYPVDQILLLDPMGYKGFIELIIDGAFERKHCSRTNIKIEYNRKKGFHLTAARNIDAGEILIKDKDTAVVSGKFVRDRWTEELDPLNHRWFRNYAYLIGPDFYRVWHRNPDRWLPINHSCDPTAWFNYGVDIVARRDIKKGQEITVDYGTHSIIEGDNNEFQCHCGSSNCRKIIRPASDYHSPEFREKYANHMTNYTENLCKK